MLRVPVISTIFLALAPLALDALRAAFEPLAGQRPDLDAEATRVDIKKDAQSHDAGAPREGGARDVPNAPVLVHPPDGATEGISACPNLAVRVGDPDLDAVDVAFYGRRRPSSEVADFAIVVLPDTQYYTLNYPEIFVAQTQWIVSHRDALNIVYVAHLGDLVETATEPSQWVRASDAMFVLEDPATTGLADGIAYGVQVGNRDQWPRNDPGTLYDEITTTSDFNAHFGVTRFGGRSYYGGHYGAGNDSHYDLVTASSMGFIVVYLEFAPTDTALRRAVIDWAENLLHAHRDRRAIIVSHFVLDPTAAFSNQGQALYDAFKDNPNVFLMLGGHLWYAARRSDVCGGSTIHSLMSNYQAAENGGNGWLRIMTFRPEADVIDVVTYSPFLDAYDTGADHQFSLPYEMTAGALFVPLGQVLDAPHDAVAAITWPARREAVAYEWYVTVSDGSGTTTGPVWTFTSGGECMTAADCDDRNDCSQDECGASARCTHTDVQDGADCSDTVMCNGQESCRAGLCVDVSLPCSDPCEHCVEQTGTCDWCVYDMDGDGWIASGDLSFLAGCYGECYSSEQACVAADFERNADGCVGPGDLAGFADCYGGVCEQCAGCRAQGY